MLEHVAAFTFDLWEETRVPRGGGLGVGVGGVLHKESM